MADEINISVRAEDNFSGVLGNFGSIITGIESIVNLAGQAFGIAKDAIGDFVNSASESELAVARLDGVLRATAPSAGFFTETVGQLSNVALLGLHEQLERAKDRLKEMKDEFGNVRTYTELETLAITVQEGKIRELTASIKQGTDGFTSYRDMTQMSRDAMIALADSLQNVTRFSDETILNGEAILLTFRNLGAETFERAVPAMLNMAEIFGSVDSSAMQLGKALNDPIVGMGALSRAGITFSDEQKNMIKNFVEMGDAASAQNIILSEVEAQVGGLAEAMGKTFSGQVDIFKNKLDNLKEMIGNAFLPTLTDLFGAFGSFVASPAVIQFIEDLGVSISDFIEPYSLLAQVFLSRIENGSDPLMALLTTLEDYNGSTGISGFVNGLKEIITTIQTFIQTGQTEGWDVALKNLFEGFNIAETIQGWIDKLIVVIGNADWGPIGETFSTIIGGSLRVVAEGLDSIIMDVDWGPAGAALRNALGEMIKGAFDSTDASYFFQQWISDIGNPYYWKNKFSEIGQSMIDGIGKTFGYNTLVEWTTDVKEGFQFFIDGIKDMLKISSPSGVFADIGKNIVLGLISGWSSAIGGFITTIEDSIKDIISLFPDWLQDMIGLDGVGTIGGGTNTHNQGNGTGTGGSTGQVVNNYYGPVYFGSTGEPNSYYDCPSPNPLVGASGNQLVVTGY